MVQEKKMKSIEKRISVFLLCMGLLCQTGCSKAALNTDVPKLEPPKVMNESFRPVSYGDVCEVVYRDGVVVPFSYCHFWDTTMEIKEIHVELGDYVEEGTLLVTADVEEIEKNIESIKKEREFFVQSHVYDEQIYSGQVQAMEYRIMAGQELMDSSGIDATAKELAFTKENHRYDMVLYEYKLKQYDKKIAKCKEDIAESKIYARHDGYVSYIKDIYGESKQAQGLENVIIISDYDNAYIELPQETVKSNICKKYTSCYTIQNGVKYELQEYGYLPQELAAAEGKDMFPCVRMRFADDKKMPSVGNSVPVFFTKDNVEDVLCISKDSLYEDSEGYYVYVKTEKGKEIRRITIGERDRQNIQVLSGLEEGEDVYYSSEAIVPSEYEVYTVASGEYKDLQKTDKINRINTKIQEVYSEYEGEIKEIVKEPGEEVKAGDVICKIKISDGVALLADLKNDIDKNKAQYDKQIRAVDETIANLSESPRPQVEITEEQVSDSGERETIIQSVVRPYFEEELKAQIDAEKYRKEQLQKAFEYQDLLLKEIYQKAKENNDGTGVISIYAEVSGVLKNVNRVPGNRVKVGEKICEIETDTKSMVEIIVDNEIPLGQSVEFVDDGMEEKYTGKVIGLAGASISNRVFVTTLETGVYITGCNDPATGQRAYVLPEDDAYFTNFSKEGKKYAISSSKTISDTYFLPAGVINSEVMLLDGAYLYYVWKLHDGQPVKHYVQYLFSAIDEQGERVDCVINGLDEGDEVAVTDIKNPDGLSMLLK